MYSIDSSSCVSGSGDLGVIIVVGEEFVRVAIAVVASYELHNKCGDRVIFQSVNIISRPMRIIHGGP